MVALEERRREQEEGRKEEVEVEVEGLKKVDPAAPPTRIDRDRGDPRREGEERRGVERERIISRREREGRKSEGRGRDAGGWEGEGEKTDWPATVSLLRARAVASLPLYILYFLFSFESLSALMHTRLPLLSRTWKPSQSKAAYIHFFLLSSKIPPSLLLLSLTLKNSEKKKKIGKHV